MAATFAQFPANFRFSGALSKSDIFLVTHDTWYMTYDMWHMTRAPENLKLAGNWPKVAAMCGLQTYIKSHIFIDFNLIIPITVVFVHFFGAFRSI